MILCERNYVLVVSRCYDNRVFVLSRISIYVSSFQSIFTAEGVFHRETSKVGFSCFPTNIFLMLADVHYIALHSINARL